MAKTTREVEVLKEMCEIGDFVAKLIKTIKEKGDYATLMPDFIAAVEGITELPEEVKDTTALVSTSVYIANNIAQVFIPKSEPVEVSE